MTLLLKKYAPELSLLLSLGAGLCAALLCSRIAGELKQTLQTLVSAASLESAAVMPVLKCVGIALVTELAGALCKDAGESALASFVELCGSLCALYTTLPLLRSLLSVIDELV